MIYIFVVVVELFDLLVESLCDFSFPFQALFMPNPLLTLDKYFIVFLSLFFHRCITTNKPLCKESCCYGNLSTAITFLSSGF